jgi:uncharacterized protein
MIEHLPDRLDLIATAEAGRALRGTIAVAEVERLLPALTSGQGELQVALSLGKDAGGTRFLAGTIEGEVVLRCQRCMQNMQQLLDIEFRLGLIRDDSAVEKLPDSYEPLEVTAEPAILADIIADEVLLALPIVPLHKGSDECRAFVEAYKPPQGEQRENPFAVLAKLKQKQ